MVIPDILKGRLVFGDKAQYAALKDLEDQEKYCESCDGDGQIKCRNCDGTGKKDE